jgi:hypothetical protein
MLPTEFATEFATEFEFTLPRGYVDEQRNLHRQGTMRLATALDEIEPLQDVRVRVNQAYLIIMLLSRVITRLGTISPVSLAVVERLSVVDMQYLQKMYLQVNEEIPENANLIGTQCPTCGTRFALDISISNGS